MRLQVLDIAATRFTSLFWPSPSLQNSALQSAEYEPTPIPRDSTKNPGQPNHISKPPVANPAVPSLSARFKTALYSSTASITTKPTFLPAIEMATTTPAPAVVMVSSALLTFSSIDFLRRHPVAMYPLEILLTLPLIAPMLSSLSSRWLNEHLSSSPLTNMIVNSNELVEFVPPSPYEAAALFGIGVWGAFMNMGISSLGNFAEVVVPNFKNPKSFSEYDTEERRDWSHLQKCAHILFHGGTNSHSAISQEQFNAPFADYTPNVVGQIFGYNIDLNAPIRAYGQLINRCHDLLPQGLQFFASAAPDTRGKTITLLNGALGTISFYGLYELLIGTHDEGAIYLMTLLSLATYPLIYSLTSEYYKKNTYSKSYADVLIYGATNITAGIFAGANFTLEFKTFLDFAVRSLIIGVLAYQVYHQNQPPNPANSTK